MSKAKWTDITSSFDIPQEPSKGYGTLALAGTFNLTDYVGKNVNIAFKYVGNGDDKKSTTYQLDNIIIGMIFRFWLSPNLNMLSMKSQQRVGMW